MKQIDDKHRYHQTKHFNDRRYDEESKRRYKCKNQSSSFRRDERFNNKIDTDFSNQHVQRNDYQNSTSKTYSYFPPPQPLMATEIAPPPSLLTAVPHERESWIRSVKKTKTTESTEQKTQYLETMLRLPQQQQQQKSSIDSSTFDRIRFADDQISTTTNSVNTENTNLDGNSFQLIRDIDNHEDICTLETILFNNQPQKTIDKQSNQKVLPSSSSVIDGQPTRSEIMLFSGFLIDNCDEEVQRSSLSPGTCSSVLPSIITEESIQQNREDSNERRVMLVNELDAADAEQRQELKRQKRLHKKIQKKKKHSKKLKNVNKEKEIIQPEPISVIKNNDNQETSSDWIIEYDSTRTDPVSQLTDMVRTTTITDEDKIVKVNMILKKIKKQQVELRKLRQYVMSMLGEQQKRNTTRQNSNINQDLLMAFINQPMLSGCWLCSGKMYTEIATQCDHVDEQ